MKLRNILLLVIFAAVATPSFGQILLRQSTQVDVRIGPFVDVGDGFTPEVGCDETQADQAELLKADGAATVSLATATLVAVTGSDGWCDLTLTTSFTDTVGELVVVFQDSSIYLPVYNRFFVVNEQAYDSLFGATSSGGVLAAGTVGATGNSTNAAHLTGLTYGNDEINGASLILWDVSASEFQECGISDWDNATALATLDCTLPESVQASTDTYEVRAPRISAVPSNFSTLAIDGNGRVDVSLVEGGDATDAITNNSGSVVAFGTAQGGSATTIQLAAGETFSDDQLIRSRVTIVGGTGAGQSRIIYDYTGATDTADVATWTTTPDATSIYVVAGAGSYTEYMETNVITAGNIAPDAIGSSEIAASAIGSSEAPELQLVLSGSAFSYPLGPFVSNTDHVTVTTSGTPSCTRSTDAPNNSTALDGSTTISALGAQGFSEITLVAADTTATDYFVINCTLSGSDPVKTVFFVQQ